MNYKLMKDSISENKSNLKIEKIRVLSTHKFYDTYSNQNKSLDEMKKACRDKLLKLDGYSNSNIQLLTVNVNSV